MQGGKEVLITSGIDMIYEVAMQTISGSHIQINVDTLRRFSTGDICAVFDHETVHVNQFRTQEGRNLLYGKQPGLAEAEAYKHNVDNFSRYGQTSVYTKKWFNERYHYCLANSAGCNNH